MLGVLLVVLATLAWAPSGFPEPFLLGLLLVFVAPALAGLALTGPVASVCGGRFALKRSLLLTVMVNVIALSVLLVWRIFTPIPGVAALPIAGLLLLVQGPALWFRHMTLFGVSRPSHARSLPASLVQPVVAVVGIYLLYPPSLAWFVATLVFLVFGFTSAALLLRAADRPLRREFSMSGVSLIRPLLDHVNGRDPWATTTIEAFFRRFAIPADLRVTLLAFYEAQGVKATVALPTVHPGPFAALGSSDLPRKLEVALGSAAGTVFVPHTPCNHDLDLPSESEVTTLSDATRRLASQLPPPSRSQGSPLVEGRKGALARAQRLGDAVLVLVTQAPAPTDDIDFSVADQLYREYQASTPLAIVDAHNSYAEDQGDLIYGTPRATMMLQDARASIAAAIAATRAGPVEVGVASKVGYSIGEQGIGPHGIRALVIRTAGTTSAYVLIDGNNLVQGIRQTILDRLAPLADVAEVMTTDNHVVHEVDGGINPVGERYPAERLARDAYAVVEEAKRNLSAVEVRVGSIDVPSVPVLGPAWTARLLTSLGDTVSMFTNMLLTTFLLLIAGSLVVLLALR